jgi:hypothetical protein
VNQVTSNHGTTTPLGSVGLKRVPAEWELFEASIG